MRTSKGIIAWANKDKAKKPKVSIVKIVSCQSNRPVPKRTRIICARKVKSKTVAGTIKNKICLIVEEKLLTSFFLSEAMADKVGKAATAKEMPKMPIGKNCKLLAKLNTAKEPMANVEAIAVITNKLICEIAKLIIRGIIIMPIFLTSLFLISI